MAVRDVRRLHDRPRLRPHIRSHDKHLSPAERRGNQQAADFTARDGIAPREDARLHRAGVGILDGARPLSVPRRDRYTLLGEILGLLLHGRCRQHHHRYSGAHRFRCIRRSLLSLPGRLQVRIIDDRHGGAGEHKKTLGQC